MNFEPIHGSIVQALCRVQATVEAVSKSDFNKHGQYKFASTDDIYASVARKFGEVGLMIMPIELTPVEEMSARVDVFDKDGNKTGEKTVTKLRFHFGYVLATAEATWFDHRSARTIIVQHTGPQTFIAAESFCQKAYLRALLKLPTGDMDLDAMPQADTDEDQAALARGTSAAPAKRKSSNAAKKDGTTTTFNEIKQKIEAAQSADMCRQIRTLYAQEWDEMPRAWHELLEHTLEDRLTDLRQLEAA